MSNGSIRTILPLATITAASMLTMDLYLPAVPTMQLDLGITVAQGQLTIAIFLLGLAASQLVWGEMLHRIGPKRCVQTGLLALILTSFGCALAPDLATLLGLRLVQGIAAGAATVVVPTVVRATLPEQDGVRGIAAIAMIEAIVPAAGPVLGTALLLIADWRTTFAIIGVMALASAPFALRATPAALPATEEGGRVGYRALLRNWHFVGLALAHALSFGALIAFVASAPQVLPGLANTGQSGFALAQVCGVAGFIVAASQAGRVSGRLGPRRAIQLGALLHGLMCTALLAAWWPTVFPSRGCWRSGPRSAPCWAYAARRRSARRCPYRTPNSAARRR
ncbi:MFS transporter [Cupriavidus gilardii]|uniref:MFS transporter n=1 Tax=Cupriavidus gilardii TaxID=82541 RepID=UPI001ABE9FD0|nr:MFS transporter [Cupriavidus gilardii]MBO4122262.1 MFS transporter [Cupriavidus gilardii]